MEIIGNTLECFDKIYSFYEPINKTFNDNIFISNSFLPQSHFENDFDDIIEEFHGITEAQLQFDMVPKSNNEQNNNHN